MAVVKGMNNFRKLDEMLSKAKINLMTRQDSVFITTVLFNLVQQWDRSIPTALTNGRDIVINPDFFERLEFAERVFVLAHEAWHVCFNHMDRTRGRDPVKWNQACDFVINLMLKDSGFKLIANVCVDEQYRDMSAEEIYDLLPDPEPGDEPGGTGSDLGDKPADMSDEDIKQHIDDIVQRAAMTAERSGAAGSVPGSIKRYLDDLSKPKVDWKKQLKNQFTAMAKKDYAMNRPNRRYVQSGIYLPTLDGEAMGEIACAVDTSGSVSQEEFTAFISEIKGIKDQFNPEKLTIIDFDTTIKNVYEIKAGENIKVEFNGWGGTDMWPVFEHYSGRKMPKCLIVFSDMYCDMSFDRPPYPVIWVCVNRPDWTHPWGKVIHYDTSHL